MFDKLATGWVRENLLRQEIYKKFIGKEDNRRAPRRNLYEWTLKGDPFRLMTENVLRQSSVKMDRLPRPIKCIHAIRDIQEEPG